MLGSSRQSLSALQVSVDARRDESGFDAVPSDLLAVAGVLGREKALSVALADSGQPAAVRTGIVDSLFGSSINAESLAILKDIVLARWSGERDLVDAVEATGAQAAFIQAEKQGVLDRVEDELFTFGRAVDESAPLQMALTDPSLSAERKGAIVNDIVAGSAHPITTQLLGYLASNLNGRRPASAVEGLGRIASDQRSQVLAEVRSVIDLTDEQKTRLAAALSALQGRQVRLNIVIDPSVLGGIVVRIGDDVIDGSVAARLEQARRAVTV
jgi:F-type H+-transporting ATPase subunit delta